MFGNKPVLARYRPVSARPMLATSPEVDEKSDSAFSSRRNSMDKGQMDRGPSLDGSNGSMSAAAVVQKRIRRVSGESDGDHEEQSGSDDSNKEVFEDDVSLPLPPPPPKLMNPSNAVPIAPPPPPMAPPLPAKNKIYKQVTPTCIFKASDLR